MELVTGVVVSVTATAKDCVAPALKLNVSVVVPTACVARYAFLMVTVDPLTV
ncbi:hypothetical protein D3C71_1300310 [compost metagenome]